MSDDLRESARRKLRFLQAMKAVAWGFFGVRKAAGSREDSVRLNPVHVIVAGILAAALFVIVLVLMVHWAVSSLT